MVKKLNTEKEDVQKGRFSFQQWVYLPRGPSKAKCISKSEAEIPALVYTVANKAENPFFVGSEQTVGEKTEALPLLLKTAGTNSSAND